MFLETIRIWNMVKYFIHQKLDQGGLESPVKIILLPYKVEKWRQLPKKKFSPPV